MIDKSVPRAPGQYDPDVVSDETGTDLSKEKDLTIQEFKKDADINEIMRRFGAYKELPVMARAPAEYGDFSSIGTFHDAMNQLVSVQDKFEALPAEMRERFHNDPAEMWNFVSDENNLEKAKEWGLLKPDVKVEDVKSVAAAPAPVQDAAPAA